MKRMTITACLIFTITLLMGVTGHLYSGDHGGGFMHRIASQLTEEQRDEIHDVADRMMEEGASRCEVHETLREMVEGYGIELPDHAPRHHGLQGLCDQLTEDQSAEVHEMVEIMTEDGASPCEIHEAVREMVEGFGVELPGRHGRGHNHRNFMH